MLKVKPLTTHEFKVDRIKDAFETACRDPGAVKVVVRP